MYKLLLATVAVLLVFIAYYGITFYFAVQVSKKLVGRAVPFEMLSEDHSVTMLVLGDSTAVGVGASKSEDTVAGRLASYIHATYVENRAVSGAVVADLPAQIQGAKLKNYSYILIHIGANDIIRFHGAKQSGEELARALTQVPQTGKLIVLTAGNVGGTTLFPWFLRPFYTMRTLEYHTVFAKVLAATKGIYVNLYIEPKDDPFTLEPEKYLAEDGLHLSSLGYEVWFETVKRNLGNGA